MRQNTNIFVKRVESKFTYYPERRKGRMKSNIVMAKIGYLFCFKNYKTSIFRVLNRNGVALNRGRHQGPHKKREDKE